MDIIFTDKNLIESDSNEIYIVKVGGGSKCCDFNVNQAVKENADDVVSDLRCQLQSITKKLISIEKSGNSICSEDAPIFYQSDIFDLYDHGANSLGHQLKLAWALSYLRNTFKEKNLTITLDFESRRYERMCNLFFSLNNRSVCRRPVGLFRFFFLFIVGCIGVTFYSFKKLQFKLTGAFKLPTIDPGLSRFFVLWTSHIETRMVNGAFVTGSSSWGNFGFSQSLNNSAAFLYVFHKNDYVRSVRDAEHFFKRRSDLPSTDILLDSKMGFTDIFYILKRWLLFCLKIYNCRTEINSLSSGNPIAQICIDQLFEWRSGFGMGSRIVMTHCVAKFCKSVSEKSGTKSLSFFLLWENQCVDRSLLWYLRSIEGVSVYLYPQTTIPDLDLRYRVLLSEMPSGSIKFLAHSGHIRDRLIESGICENIIHDIRPVRRLGKLNLFSRNQCLAAESAREFRVLIFQDYFDEANKILLDAAKHFREEMSKEGFRVKIGYKAHPSRAKSFDFGDCMDSVMMEDRWDLDLGICSDYTSAALDLHLESIPVLLCPNEQVISKAVTDGQPGVFKYPRDLIKVIDWLANNKTFRPDASYYANLGDEFCDIEEFLGE